MNARITTIVVVVALFVLSLAILANSMTKPAGRDEQMYCTGAVLLAQGKMIYRDFSYAAQMPYHPLLCAALYKISGTTCYLLVGRLLSVVCDILTMVCIAGIYRRVFRPYALAGALLGLAACVLYLFNPLVDYANGYAWNHDAVILCVALSLWLFIGADSQPQRRAWRVAAIGALLTFATWMRITTALIELVFFVMVLSLPAGAGLPVGSVPVRAFRRVRLAALQALPFLIASALVSVWPVWVIAQAPRAFYLNIVKIPMLYGQWLHEIGMVFDKFVLTFACLSRPGYLVLILLAVYLFATIAILRQRLKIESGRSMILAALLPVAFFVIALIPPTMWQQYLGVPVPFLVISLAFPLACLRRLGDKAGVGKHFRVAAVAAAICAAIAILSYPQPLQIAAFALAPERWVPIERHKMSQDIASRTKEPRQVLTLTPLLALEGGCEIYTELSAGGIIYRIGDSLTPEEREVTHTVGPKGLPKLLEGKPPSAVILGEEMQRLETPIYESVVKGDWKKQNYQDGPTAYFRP